MANYTPNKNNTNSPYHSNSLNIQQFLEKIGNAHEYQRIIIIIFILQFLFSAYIEMGFPIIFQEVKLICQNGLVCPEEIACKQNFTLSDDIKSVAYTFDLYCQNKKYLSICFDAFLYGGFFGCLYYGQVIERKGRKYVVNQSMLIMLFGIVVSLLTNKITIFSIGVFLLNFGFRGFYNAAVLTLTEVTSQTSRATIPIFLHLGWAAGQIFIAIIGSWVTYWRTIFIFTGIPLTILLYFSVKNVKESPRALIVKHEFQAAKRILQQISIINNRPIGDSVLEEQKRYLSNIENYQDLNNGDVIVSNTKHHSYSSLFKFSSIRIRVFILAYIWSIISLSYFTSASTLFNENKSISFNLALAGAVQVIAYLLAAKASINMQRLQFIKNLIIYSGIVHLFFFFIRPIHQYGPFGRLSIMTFDILIRLSMSIGNVFLLVYSIQLFPTTVRHFAIGLLGFCTKFMFMLTPKFIRFWDRRDIHPDFVIGLLLLSSYFFIGKLRETKNQSFKDNLQEDDQGIMMTQIRVF